MSDITHLLWLDLETTGTDEKVDNIIEVGVILTDTELNEVESYKPYSEVAPATPEAMQRLLQTPAVREMHAANGLLWEVLDLKANVINSQYLWMIEASILNPLYEITKKHEVMLAGSGVGHFDRRFLREYMTKLHNHLAYPVLDVGVIRRAYKLWNVAPIAQVELNIEKTHRALDDARLHLEEARLYKEQWAKLGAIL